MACPKTCSLRDVFDSRNDGTGFNAILPPNMLCRCAAVCRKLGVGGGQIGSVPGRMGCGT